MSMSDDNFGQNQMPESNVPSLIVLGGMKAKAQKPIIGVSGSQVLDVEVILIPCCACLFTKRVYTLTKMSWT